MYCGERERHIQLGFTLVQLTNIQFRNLKVLCKASLYITVNDDGSTVKLAEGEGGGGVTLVMYYIPPKPNLRVSQGNISSEGFNRNLRTEVWGNLVMS